jgi:hypothetical protein
VEYEERRLSSSLKPVGPWSSESGGVGRLPVGTSTILIVNWDNDSTRHTPITRKESDAKVIGRFFRDPSFTEVRV